MKHSMTTLSRLCSVAVDSCDDIYCTNGNTNKILRCDKNGGHVQVYEVQQVKDPGHHGVAVVGDEVMVCECGNKGTIMVYNRELKYVRHIEHAGSGAFTDISVDSHGNLYVTDYTNSMIRVFSNDGILLRSLSLDGDGKKRLNRPCLYMCVWSLCVCH